MDVSPLHPFKILDGEVLYEHYKRHHKYWHQDNTLYSKSISFTIMAPAILYGDYVEQEQH